MTGDKVRNLSEDEIRHQERDLNDQLFRLKFQMKMGQTESLKKIRGLRKDIARMKTIARERVLANGNGNTSTDAAHAAAAVAPKAAKKPAAAKASTKTKTVKQAEKQTATGRK
ncbi:MAG: 50S ribosomal protein L29 [Acidobacteriota bacterium]|nr:50S ribosomal protein L29 [Acidobacteriota bacterium]